jgi:adenylylsulfate kinase
VDVAEQRDTDGWYERARRHEVEDFTGVNAPYEPPSAPEVHIRSDVEPVRDAAAKVMAHLEEIRVIPRVVDQHTQEELKRRLSALGYS